MFVVVSVRLQVAENGLDWPYCTGVGRLTSSAATQPDYPANATRCTHLHPNFTVAYTMSGFEIAGVVLAVLPLMGKALESYSAGVSRLTQCTAGIR